MLNDVFLSLNHCGFAFGKRKIFDDISLSIHKDDKTALVGKNGVGKTTLLKTLIGLLKPKRGEILLIGENINRKPPHQRARKGMAYVPKGR